MSVVCKGTCKDYPTSQGEMWRDKHPLSSEQTSLLTLPATQNSVHFILVPPVQRHYWWVLVSDPPSYTHRKDSSDLY